MVTKLNNKNITSPVTLLCKEGNVKGSMHRHEYIYQTLQIEISQRTQFHEYRKTDCNFGGLA